MTDHQAACAALREAHAAIKAGNLGLAELAVRDAERAMANICGRKANKGCRESAVSDVKKTLT